MWKEVTILSNHLSGGTERKHEESSVKVASLSAEKKTETSKHDAEELPTIQYLTTTVQNLKFCYEFIPSAFTNSLRSLLLKNSPR